jgi:adenylate cyclase
MGIGINTGQMKVGNMGSATRFDYTVIGDSVNLGARLESLNKEYGTTLIVSGTTLAEAGAGFHSRFLDLVAVKGKSEPVEVFQIMTPREFATPGVSEAIGAYAAGMQAYLERDWLGAAARFQEALRHCPSDGPSALYLERCELLMDTPPPADWNGVFVMTHK